MKKRIVFLLLGLLSGLAFGQINVMSFNIRYGSANDGDNSWQYRKNLVFETIENYHPDIIGMQEALYFQIQEILDNLDSYTFVGVGREDGVNKGEFSNILYDSSKVKVMKQGTFWLSDTPEVPGSITWGNACTRVCTWAGFRTLYDNKTFYVFNLHLDHKSQFSREKSIALVLDKINEMGDIPCILTGDFNAGEENPAIQALLTNSNLKDSFRIIHPKAQTVGTFNAFSGIKDGDKIDYVFNSKHFTVKDAAIIRDHKDGRFPSDHFPVVAELEW